VGWELVDENIIINYNSKHEFMRLMLLIFLVVGLQGVALNAQENDLSGVELSMDQDAFADAFREADTLADRNYTIGLRVGIYGAWANHVYLGLPWVRQKIDGFLLDKLLERGSFIQESKSHNFVFTINGFSPSYVNDTDGAYLRDVALGYDHSLDRPFSSFTGFRASRRVQGKKRFVHSAYTYDLAVTSSFTFGFASFGMAGGMDNWLRGDRNKATLWDRDEDKDFPTGHIMQKGLPIFMYSVSGEAVLFQPLRKVLVQVRPEINLGYYTNVGIGVDVGKVMNVDRHVDNQAYTDTNNPSLLSVNNDNLSFSIVGGAAVRGVLYNAHLNGLYGKSEGHFFTFKEMKKFLWEMHAGIKIQLLKKAEFTWSITRRSAEIKGVVNRSPLWGTFAVKYLIAPEGEGCYN